MPSSPAVSKAEYEVLSEFRYTLRRFLRFSESAARQLGVTPQQHQALLAIKGFPGRDKITVGELAERLQVRHHSAVGLADRLEAQDLVTRSAALADRRKVYLELTPYGNSIIDQLSAMHHDELVRMLPQLRGLVTRIGRLSAHGKPGVKHKR